MISARISLKRTVKDELLFSALVEVATVYSVSINDKSERLKAGDKAEFKINTNREGSVFNMSVLPQMQSSTSKKLRVNIIRKNEGEDVEVILIATVDNPYRVTTDGSGKYIIVHKIAAEDSVLNGKLVGELSSTT